MRAELIDHIALCMKTHPDILRGAILLNPILDTRITKALEAIHKVFVTEAAKVAKTTKLPRTNLCLTALNKEHKKHSRC